LLGFAGERANPRPESYERGRALAMASWQRMLDEQARARRARQRHWLVWLAAAASLAAVTTVTLLLAPDSVVLRPMDARVERIAGSVQLLRDHEQSRSIALGESLSPGTVVTGETGRLAIRVSGAHSLRLDHSTEVRLGHGGVILVRGAIYFESGAAGASSPAFQVSTPAGEVQHLGTQYEARVHEGSTSVSVREGQVRLGGDELPGQPLLVSAGEELFVSTTGHIERRPVSLHGARWAWASAIAPAFDIENRSAADFLAWIAREHGWALRFDSDDARSAARAAVLHGSISSLTADQALRRVATITGLSFSVADGVLTVSVPTPQGGSSPAGRMK
jgi:ferric-dicitrate binding protein FerR (iron transport regulator)